MSSSGLVTPLGSAERAAQVTGNSPILEESRDTSPWPSMSEPSQWAFATRVVAMRWSFLGDCNDGCVSTSADATPQEPSFYQAVGGADTFRRLVTRFYAGVADDPVLRPLYPEEDLGPAADRLRMFLEQYWGGPRTYSEERGHPRLRARHAPFRVDEAARVAWLSNMRAALDEIGLHPEADLVLWDYLKTAAQMLVNTE